MRLIAVLLSSVLTVPFLAPFSQGHCGHWVVKHPECEDLTFVFCEGNFTKCGTTSDERLAGNCTVEACDPMADDVILALNGTGGAHLGHEGHGSGGHSYGSTTTSAGSLRCDIYSCGLSSVFTVTFFIWVGTGTY
jgi:hypothetical protein